MENTPTIDQYKTAYFIGIGGIGMSALARYFNLQGFKVKGYDKTASPLTDALIQEGIEVHFEDLGNNIPIDFQDKKSTLIVYTPAIPKHHGELNFFLSNEYRLFKRSEVLGLITKNTKGLGVAGTHGKTTTSSLLANILNHSKKKCNAFLGGIATNFNSNLVYHKENEFTVVEADEFDRSFLKLNPFAAIVTSVDPDHLDIYGDPAHFKEGFEQFTQLISEKGCLIQKEGLNLPANCTSITYSIESSTAHYSADNLKYENGRFLFNAKTPEGNLSNIELGIPGIHNTENALACIALCEFLGIDEQSIREGLKTFKGVKRRFEYQIKTENLVFIDDYAHHPTEINALIDSVKMLYPNQKITGIFQPHLFSRTRDFFNGFSQALSRLDDVILLPIYPAREEPIEGVTSNKLMDNINHNNKHLFGPEEVLDYLQTFDQGVLLTIGAGDIDRIVPKLKDLLS